MKPGLKVVAALCLALGMAGGFAPPAVAGPAGGAPKEAIEVGPEGLTRIAMIALANGHPDIARKAALSLIARNPEDFGAQILLSHAARDLGDYAEAAAAARKALSLARNDGQKTQASFAMAQARSSAGNRTAAQFWLRRAAQTAPTPQIRAQAIRDFRYVRMRNPWTVNLDFGASPSSNVNGGTGADTIWIYGLPFTLSGDSQALSGLEEHASLSVERTVIENERHVARLGFNLAGRTYTLSDAAKRKAPGAQGSDYAFWASEIYLAQRWHATRGRDEWDLRLLAGHNDYSGAPLSNYLGFDAGRSFTFGADRALHLGTTVQRQWRLDNDVNSSVLRMADLDWRQRLGPGVFSFGLFGGQAASDARTVASIRKGVSLGYDLAKPVFGAALSFDLGYERRDFGLMPFDSENRTDHRVTLGATAFLRDHDYLGFAPELGLTYTRNRSNSVLYDSRDMSFSMRLRSAF
ncbi:MAG: surface lipoprotein assembly modifier [Paenirhodobacter sp.]|uniref:tetratricopeptide repeat protein n=1 Tax=Paenirhodobacter sp. TaxID=1965326 RepID=UPI003D101B55